MNTRSTTQMNKQQRRDTKSLQALQIVLGHERSGLLKRLEQFAAQTDQYPPTLKPTITNGTGHVTYNGSTSWNFQCPQCRVVGAHGSPKAWRPWCDGVQCKPESCESLFFGDQCSDRALRD